MKDNKQRDLVYLAAIIQNVGKLYERADIEFDKRKSSFSSKINEMLAPVEKTGRVRSYHWWAAQFIEDYRNVFDSITNNRAEQLVDLIAGSNTTEKASKALCDILAKAEAWALGIEKIDTCDNTEEIKRTSMISIMETVGLNSREIEKKENWKKQPAIPLDLTKNYFPHSTVPRPDYVTLWKAFVEEFEKVKYVSCRTFSENILNLLLKYASSVPTNSTTGLDVSLYDHTKSSAAIALCLYDAVEMEQKNEDDALILIGADFSGIQSYIYQIVSKYAGKNLKGRSFYLRMLSDAIVRRILKDLDLRQANIVYNSGGGFYILAPNTADIKHKLDEVINIIEEKLFATHETSLYVAIDYVTLSKAALLHQDGFTLGQIWANLFKKRDRKKNTKFSSLLKNNFKDFFLPTMVGGENKTDAISGEEFKEGEKSVLLPEIGKVKEITNSQIQIGKALREVDIMVVSESEIDSLKHCEHIEPIELGFWYYFISTKDGEKANANLSELANKISIITLNGDDRNCQFIPSNGNNSIYSLQFYGGNEMRRVLTFEELCENSDQEDAFSRLGVLRMDVDNLGSIFQSGISPERASLARFSSLSRCFDYFFSGYLNTICAEVSKDKLFIIYSGGDDLFIIGSWNKTIECANRIRKDFKAFACENPKFSISGGIAIVEPKFPIMKAAEQSAEEEERAKGHQCKQCEKNAISFLSFPINWDKEYEVVEKLKNNIVKCCETDCMPRSFVGKVLQHYSSARIDKHEICNPKVYWMISYDFSRLKERIKDIVAKELVNNCVKEICCNSNKLNGAGIHTDYHPLELWAFACRWAELELRMN